MAKSLRNLSLIAFLFAIICSQNLFAQLSGTKNIPGDYASLDAAITDLNTQGVGAGGVVLNVVAANPQSAPAGGYSITATGTVANPITITGNANTITASNALVVGNLNDGIFKLIGSDYVTIQGFTMLENAANLVTAAATNNMTEWGVALLYASVTDGAQNCTIQNNTITLNRTYQNTFGVYSNSTHTATTPTTSATATGSTGGNSGLRIYGNAIDNVNQGIVIVGPTAAADANTGIDVGGSSLAQGNTLTNYGTTGTFSAYANVSATVNGILIRNSNGFNCSYNTVTSSVGGVTAGTLNGIQVPAASAVPTTTFTNNITFNSISLKSGLAAGAMTGISYPSGSASTTSILNINNNDFNNWGHTVAASGTIIFITTASVNLTTSISNNTFTNMSVNTTGSVTFILQTFTLTLAGGSKTVSGNSIVTGFTKTGAGGTILLVSDNGSSTNVVQSNCQNNNFSNISVTGATTLTGLNYTDGGTAPSRTVSGNTLNNWTGGTSTINCMNFTYWSGSTSTLNTNTVTNITGQGAVTGITIGNSALTANPMYVSNNTVNNLSSTGTGGAVTGIASSSAAPGVHITGNTINTLSSTGASAVNGITISGAGASNNVYRNKIYDLAGSNAASTVNGILISAATASATVNAYNNIIGDLRTPNTSSITDAIRGISMTGTSTTGTFNISFNSIFINATSVGANFSTSGIFHTTSATATTSALNMRGNLVINMSTPNGTGVASAYRRSSTTLTNYGSASNNNLLYAGTPGVANLIFYDGTNSDQTIDAFKLRVVPRDANSATENVAFVSTTGSSSDFLRPDSTIASFTESGGITVTGITTDYRTVAKYPNSGYPNNPSFPAFAPDLGAYEIGGIWNDVTGPIISYTALPNTANLTNRTLTATIIDPSGVQTGANGPRLYYKKSTDISYQFDASPSVAGNDYTFTINAASLGGVAGGDIIEYYVAAQDLNAYVSTNPAGGSGSNPPGTTAPGTPASYNILPAPLSGDYTVGTVAFNRATGLNLKLEKFTRRVMKEVEVSEDAAPKSNQEKISPAPDVLAAAPSTGNTVMMEVEEEYYVLMNNGQKYEGPLVHYTDNMAIYATMLAAITDLNLRGVGGATRFLLTDATYTEAATLSINITAGESLPNATNTVTFKPQPFVDAEITVNSTGVAISVANNYVIFDGSNTDGGTSRNLTLTNSGITANSGALFVTGGNCTVKHTNARSSLYLYGYGIVFSGTTAGNGIVTNCGITRAAIGIQSQGSLNTMSITNNDVGSADSLNTVANLGIGILNTTNFTVNNNRVVGINRWATSNAVGILVGFSAGIMATPGTITQNTISNVKHMGYDGSAWGAWGIQLATTEAASDILIANNSISDIYSQGDGGTTGAEYVGNGIYITSGGGYKIYNNSINLFGELTDPGAASVMRNAGIVIAAVTGAGNLDIRNNIFVNGQTYLVAAASKRTYGIYSVAANTVFTQLDYNDYYGYGVDGALGYLGSERTTIVAWRTASGKDVNSTTWDPGFTSPTNLLPNPAGGACWGVNGTGYPLTAVPTDISGNSRSTTIANGPTDMGAYEFTPSTPPPVATQTITADGTYDYAIGGRLFASVTITGYVADAAAFDISMLHYSGVTPPGGTTQEYANSYDSIWVSAGSFSAASYEVRLYVNDNNMRNIANANNIVLAKSNDGGALWTPSPGTTNGFTAGSPGYGYATGLTTFSLFTITSTDNPLPVELASFTSSIDRRNVTLKWSTASELNNSGFDVERKSIGTENTWSKVGSIAGAGSSTTIKNYSFTENNLNTGKYNYRLKQIDFNGNFKYYDLSGEVIIGVPSKFEISQNYPNPFNPSTKINYDLPFDSKVQIKIFDITGREVFQLVNEARAAGYHTVQFNASSMASGVYFYMISANGGNQSFAKTMKMVLVK